MYKYKLLLFLPSFSIIFSFQLQVSFTIVVCVLMKQKISFPVVSHHFPVINFTSFFFFFLFICFFFFILSTSKNHSSLIPTVHLWSRLSREIEAQRRLLLECLQRTSPTNVARTPVLTRFVVNRVPSELKKRKKRKTMNPTRESHEIGQQ